jgi:hypothetical protein|tara:strand:- start:1632 stop:2252 length:621 start_codon:yes stop_codon:yes gene_type:complete
MINRPITTLEENSEELDLLLSNPNSSNPDAMTALGAIPGTGMNDPKGKWAWEQPPKITDPDEAVDAVMDQFEEEPNKTNVLKLMVAGVSIEELVNITVFNAFSEGAFTPDVAEIIKPALVVGLVQLAGEQNVPFRMFSDPVENQEMDDKEVFRIMKERNPQVFRGIKEDLNRKIREGQNPRPTQQPMPMPVKQPSEQSFLEMGVQE